VRENGFTQTPSDSICTGKGQCSRVSFYKDNHLKTLIKEGTELLVPIWHSGTREAFLIHVGSAGEAIKKKGYFKSFEDHSNDYSEKRGKVKELKDQLVALKEALAAQPKDPKETTVEAVDCSKGAIAVSLVQKVVLSFNGYWGKRSEYSLAKP
jgi:hypothetical protein